VTPEEALAIYRAGPDVVVKVLCEFSRRVDELQEDVQKLKDQIDKNSGNSNKPPSSDGPKKPAPRSLRKRSERKPGGQKGHCGSTLKMVDNPDRIVVCPVDRCGHCGRSLKDKAPSGIERRQLFYIPPIRVEVTEHQAESKECPYCGTRNKAAFPKQAAAPVQYGPRLKATAVYLRQYQLLPYNRTRELFHDLFSIDLCDGTLMNITETCSELLHEPLQQIRQHLKRSPVANFDETGSSVEGKRQWLHAACNAFLTYYEVHPKRGCQATEHIGILPDFKGRAIHDFWKPYFKYDCAHGLCNAHHLRELTFIHEQYNQAWAKDMLDCLLDIKNTVDETKKTSDALSKKQIGEFETRYQNVLDEGYNKNSLPKRVPVKKKRGRRKKSKARNLLERLDKHRKQTLAFMYDFDVPFDNNLAERDIRMTKLQQKISGGFRSQTGAHSFCRIRSYISTVRKNAVNVIDAIEEAFKGQPFLPTSGST